MYEFIVRRSRSWVMVSKVETFLPAAGLARCSWHKSGLRSFYCVIGGVLLHWRQVKRKPVINHQFKLTQRKSKTHPKTFLRCFHVGGEGLIASSVRSFQRSNNSLRESFSFSPYSFFLSSCKAHRFTLRSWAAESDQIRRGNYKAGRKSTVWLWNAGGSADATTRERNMTFFFFFLLFFITNHSDGVNVKKVAQCFPTTPWKTLAVGNYQLIHSIND